MSYPIKKRIMYQYLNKILLLVSISVALTACSPKIPFSQNLRDKYKLSDADLKGLQFYISDAIVLKRGEDLGREKGTNDGTLVIKSGKNLEQIVFKRNTACVVNQAVDNTKLTMVFEEDSKKFLVFGSDGDPNGYYSLKALEWINNKGKINYGDQTYYTNPGSQKTFLLFKMKSLRKIHMEEKVVKGKKVKIH